ncbi:hypothetical protein MZM54_01685 [[Brevibacterium] frigoritolerans]|nr:hypothetical protein [Peribacillus frigoritolerans]
MNGLQMRQTVTSITKAIMDPNFRARKNYTRPPFVFWGPKGSGKTYDVNTAATDLKIPAINIRLGQELAEDMSYPEIKEENKQKYLGKIIAEMFPKYKTDKDGNKIPRQRINEDGDTVEIEGEYQINFTLIKNYIENWDKIVAFYENQGLSVDDAPGAIVFLDEINRIEDKQMFQMIFQLFDSGKFKGYVTPEEIAFFGAANPSEGYIVSKWFNDPAFANRCIHLKRTYDIESWKGFAKRPDSGYDDLTIAFYEKHPKALFDEKENSFELPKFSSSFRNAAYLSLYINGVEYPDPEISEDLLASVIGPSYISPFHTVEDELAEKARTAKAPTAKEVLSAYDEYECGDQPLKPIEKGINRNGDAILHYEIATMKDAIDYQPVKGDLRKRFLKARDTGKADVINETTEDIINYIHDNIENEEFKMHLMENKLRFVRFIFDLPRGKLATTMNQLIGNRQRNTTPLVASVLTTGPYGQEFIQLVKYNDERINPEAQIS